MEYCIESGMRSALKSSFLSDSSTFLLDDFFSFNAASSVAVAATDVDFSSVDSFLDLSDEKSAFVRQEAEAAATETEEDDPSELVEISNSQDKAGNLDFTTSFPGVSVQFPLPQQQIEDFEDLEWLSRFVDHDEDNDSDSKLTILYSPINNRANHHHQQRSQPSSISPPILLCFSSPIPAKSRSKRTRLPGKLWGSASALSISSSSSSSSSCSIISYGSSNPSITSNNNNNNNNNVPLTPPPPPPGRTPTEMKKKRSWSESETQQQSRRCSHCHVQKTPQWRSGPLGAKTLCNACGVRYKSGRLFPEYRPACSPSFTGELHSNSHRKVLEMRRKKEINLA